MSLDDLLKRPADPLIGKRLGQVLVDRWMADGTTGTIYFGNHAVSKKEVAIRVLRPEMTKRVGFADKFLEEARVAQQLKHPNVVGVVDAGESGRNVYVAMEFVRGEPLKAFVRRSGNKLSFEKATRYIRDIARGLEAAHNLDLVHGDIRPSNILVDADGHPRINNFGLARPASVGSGRTQVGDFVGPPDFLAPEQVDGGIADARSDQYSLGLLYYYVMTGEYPFAGANDSEVAQARLKEDVPPIEGLPERGKQLLERMTARSPRNRFFGMREVIGACEKAMYSREDIEGTSRTVAPPANGAATQRRTGRTVPTGRKVSIQAKWTPELKLGWVYLLYVTAVGCVVAGAGMRTAPAAVRAAFLSIAFFPLAGFITLLSRQKTGWRGVPATLLGAASLGLLFFGFSTINSWGDLVAPVNAMALGAVIILSVAVSVIGRFERGWVRQIVLLAGFALLAAGAVEERTARGMEWLQKAPGPALGIMAVAALGMFCAVILLCSSRSSGWVRAIGFVAALVAMIGLAMVFRGLDYKGLAADFGARTTNHGTVAALGVLCAACGHYLLAGRR